jgi:hypothetical protein
MIVVGALVVVAGVGAFGADAWAKGQVCDAVKQWSGIDSSSGKSGGKGGSNSDGESAESVMPTVAEINEVESGLNSRASLLFFHGDLKVATHELADDFGSAKTLVQSGKLDNPDDKTLTQLVALAGSLDTHTRKAERACGLPEKSMLGTTA